MDFGSLLYYYTQEKRSYDDVDGPFYQDTEGSLSAEYVASPFGSEVLGEMAFPQLPNQPSPPVAFHYAPLNPEQQDKTAMAGKKLAKMTTKFFANQTDRSVVRFKNSFVSVLPEKQTVSIPIIRSPGCDDVSLTAKWKTYDKTALSGTHYVGTEGKISLESCEKEKKIEVEILSFNKIDVDLRFQIELAVENSFFAPKPLTVHIQNLNKFDIEDKRVIENLLESSPTSASDVLFILGDNLNQRTFYSGLSCFCSKADSLPLEMGLALEFTSLCLEAGRLRLESAINTLKDFFGSVELPDDF